MMKVMIFNILFMLVMKVMIFKVMLVMMKVFTFKLMLVVKVMILKGDDGDAEGDDL